MLALRFRTFSDIPQQQKKGYISGTSLLLIAFSFVFFPRLVDAAGAPSAVNFLHFAVVPAVFLISIFNPPRIGRAQTKIIYSLLVLLLILLTIIVASALFNGAGVINALLSFLLLAEPLIFLVSLLNNNLTIRKFNLFRKWIIRFSIFHIALALLQKILLDVGIMKAGELGIVQDNIQGVFYLSGGGHVVAATVSMYFGIYYLVSSQSYPKSSKVWSPIGLAILAAATLQLLFADAKQVMLVLIVAWGLLALTKLKNITTLLKYLLMISLFLWAFIWCMNNLTLFRAFTIWLRPDIYGTDGVATQLKIAAFPIIHSHYQSPINWLLGIGPGHTVGRLGGWFIREYANLLRPLGATAHIASQQTWDAVYGVWIGNKSSMFSPLFGWAGIWGDLGFLGLIAYLSMGVYIWKCLCLDDFSRFVLLTMIVHGFIFTQLEEPGFMVYSATLIFLRWKEKELSTARFVVPNRAVFP